MFLSRSSWAWLVAGSETRLTSANSAREYRELILVVHVMRSSVVWPVYKCSTPADPPVRTVRVCETRRARGRLLPYSSRQPTRQQGPVETLTRIPS